MEKRKVLVIEDSPQWQRMYKRELGDCCEVIIAETVEAGERLYVENPDIVLIVMDACVPGDEPTTLELTEKIRKSFTGPMIAVSSMIEYRDALLAAGCDYDSGKASVIEMVKNLLSL